MRKPALERCSEFDWVEIAHGTANELPLETDSIDKAISVQVFEYLDNILGAVGEAHRVLKPGGRLVIGDIHLDNLIWFSQDTARMNRMVEAWDHHFTERGVSTLLPPIMRSAGFVIEDVRPLTICDYTLKPDGLATMMMQLMARYAAENNHVPAEEAQAWLDEQKSLAEDGRFFYSLTHFVVSAQKL
jgi:arsenite methyltransferase